MKSRPKETWIAPTLPKNWHSEGWWAYGAMLTRRKSFPVSGLDATSPSAILCLLFPMDSGFVAWVWIVGLSMERGGREKLNRP